MKFKNHLDFQAINKNTLHRDNKTIPLKEVHLGKINKSPNPVKNSVIMSHYNRVDLAIEGIQSVLRQKLPEIFEVIVVDDASTDDISEISKRFKDNPRFSLISLANNHGNESLPQNIGIHFSKGKFLSFLDSDDEYIGENALHTMNMAFDNPNVIMACSDIVAQTKINLQNTLMQWICEKLNHISRPNQDLSEHFKYYHRIHKEYSIYDLLEHPYYSGIRMVQREALYEIGGWPEELQSVDDLGMVLNLHAIGKIQPVNVPLYLWKIHNSNDSQFEYSDTVQTEIRKYIIKHIKERNITFADLQNNCSQEFWDLYKISPQDL